MFADITCGMRRVVNRATTYLHCALLLLACAGGGAPAGATTQWSPTIRLSSPDTTAWFPGIAADAAGGVHVFWAYSEVSNPGFDAVIYCPVTPNGCAERIPALLREAWGGYYVTRPSPVVSPTGTLHTLWNRKATVCLSSTPVQGPYGASHWTRPLKMGDPTAYSALAVDSRGVLHAAWSQGVFGDRADPCHGCADIFYSRSLDDGIGWSIPRNITQTPRGSEKPHLAFGPDDAVYVAWEEGRDRYAGKGQAVGSMMVASADGGTTWDRPSTIEAPGHVPHSTAIGVDRHNKVVVVWQQDQGRDIFWQVSSDRGATWSPPTRFPGLIARSIWNKLDTYHMAPDGARNLHVVLTGRYEADEVSGGPNHVFHLEWDGNGWSEPTSLYTTAGTPEWSRIAVNEGNQIHAVWFERPAGFEWKHEEAIHSVWYARGTSSAPAIAAVPWPVLERPFLTGAQWFRLAQGVLGVGIVAIVIGATRRRGW